MKYDEIQKPFREMLGVTQVFRKLGFVPDDIMALQDMFGHVFVVLQTQGKSFSVACGRMPIPQKEFADKWAATAKAWNDSMSDEDRQRIYSESYAFRNRLNLLLRLTEKGITYANREAAEHLN